MHMGSLGVIGSIKPNNLVHILINNGSHETVGGMPTVMNNIDVESLVKACNYTNIYSVDNFEDLDRVLNIVKNTNELSFIEIKSRIGARENLGRPTIKAIDNKINFMNYLKEL